MKAVRHTKLIYKRALTLLFLFLFLASCSRKKEWIFYEDGPLSMATSTIENLYTGIEVQFMQGAFGTLCYLNVYSHEISGEKEDPKSVGVLLVVDENAHPFKAIRMEGGQKLLLPNEATTLLINALCQSVSVKILVPGGIATLKSTRDLAAFKKLQKNAVL